MFDITSWKDAGSAIDAFKHNQETITQQLGHIDGQLENMFWQFADKPKDWGYPGSQGRVMELLNEIIEFLGPTRRELLDPAADGRQALQEDIAKGRTQASEKKEGE